MEHHLKIWPTQFEAIVYGKKRFEWRKDDRDPRFDIGDALILEEFFPDKKEYSGRTVTVRVTYVMRQGFGFPDGYCVMGFEKD